jgi:RHS repeat-associated protein
LNRLVYQDALNGFSGNSWTGMATMGEQLKERITYDDNGNIKKYLRKSIDGTHMDSLTYEYYAATNQLRRIIDSVPANVYTGYVPDIETQADNNYTYDSIGNLVKDNAEGITNIKWNVYGKIQEISRTATTALPVRNIKYTYDALGNRISQIDSTSGGMKYYTWYVRDAQGNILSTYTAEGTLPPGSLTLRQDARYIFGSSRIGSYSLLQSVDGGPTSLQNYAGGPFNRGWKQYELTSHLGNVLAVVSDKKIGVPSASNSSLIDHYEPEIISATDYYPFGMPSRVALGSGKAYRFGFNGKENDNDVKGYGNQQDYGMRIYDPRVGRFLSVDPLTKQYPHYTPYSFAGNKPISYIDRDGEEEALELRTRGLEEALLNHTITHDQYKEQIRARAMGGVLGGAIVLDIYVTKGRATKSLGSAMGWWAYFKMVDATNANSNQRDPKIRAENEQKAKEAAAEIVIGFGSSYLFSKGLQAAKMAYQEAKGVLKADPMIAEMSQPLKAPLPALSELPKQADRVFNHFTDIKGVSGITGINTKSLENLKVGESITVNKLSFGNGTNDFMSAGKSEIFVTNLPTTATPGQLNLIGVFESSGKQSFSISFSEEAAFSQGVKVTGANTQRNIYTIPAGSQLNGTFTITRTRK